MIHCDTERYEAFGNDCRCKGQRKCLVVYCHKTDIVEILTMNPTKKPKASESPKIKSNNKKKTQPEPVNLARGNYKPPFDEMINVALKSSGEENDIKILAGNETFSKKSTKKRGLKMLQRLKKIDAEKDEKPPVALKSATQKQKQKQTESTTETSTTTSTTKNERERPKRAKKEAKRNMLSGDVLVQAEAKFVKHGKGRKTVKSRIFCQIYIFLIGIIRFLEKTIF